MIDKWLHLRELNSNPWVLPIWTSVNHAKATGRVPEITPEIGEIGVHISTRLTMLPHVIARLNKDVSDLYDAAKNYKSEHIFTKTSDGVPLPVDDNIKYLVIADVDSFLFEINACTELMQKFFQLLHRYAGNNIENREVTNAVQTILKKNGVSKDWFKKLDQARNFAAHDGTPYIAIDISKQGNWKTLFMKESTVKFEDNRKFFSIADLQEIADGFLLAKAVLQEHLVNLFQSGATIQRYIDHMNNINSLELKVPPVAVFFIFAVLLWLAAKVLPFADIYLPARKLIAIGIAAVGGMYAGAAIWSFLRARTTLNPMDPGKAASLVTNGIYAVSRNPMYASLLLVLAGWAIYLSNLATLLPLPLFVAYMNRFQIMPEERALASLFGGGFEAYRKQVRRWL